MVDAGEKCIGWEARDRDLMRGTVKKKNIDKNVKTLKNAAKIAFTWAKKNAVQFDDLKSELIHFESYKTTLNQMIILLNNMIIKSKTCVW